MCIICVAVFLPSGGHLPFYTVVYHSILYSKHCLTTHYISTALEEARDITIHLKPLRRLLDDMEQFDFSELDKIIPAILHTVGLIWANSKYYCRAPRIIVLLQELCNMLIEMVCV